jgi:HSP20 family protein
MAKKKYPLWYESLEGLGRIDEEIRGIMKDFGSQLPRLDFQKAIPVEIAETDNEVALRAELPGFSKDEIKLNVSSNSAEISAQKRKVSEERGDNFFRTEKTFGAARRTVPLPAEVKTDGVKAKFENGVLKVVMLKKGEKKDAKQVRVE